MCQKIPWLGNIFTRCCVPFIFPTGFGVCLTEFGVRAEGVGELVRSGSTTYDSMHTRLDHANYQWCFGLSIRRFLRLSKRCVMIYGTGCGGVLARGKGNVPLSMLDQYWALKPTQRSLFYLCEWFWYSMTQLQISYSIQDSLQEFTYRGSMFQHLRFQITPQCGVRWPADQHIRISDQNWASSSPLWNFGLAQIRLHPSPSDTEAM